MAGDDDDDTSLTAAADGGKDEDDSDVVMEGEWYILAPIIIIYADARCRGVGWGRGGA
jgi:hypothetical protein